MCDASVLASTIRIGTELGGKGCSIPTEMATMGERNTTLDPRQRIFIELYLESGNQTQSYVAAGYTTNVKSASVQASRLLAKPRVRNEVARRSAELLAKYSYSPERIVRELTRIAAANADDYLSDDRSRVDLSRTTRDQLAAIAAVDVGEFGTKVRLWDKQKALAELARIARLYPQDRSEINGVIEHTHKIDIESLGDEDRQKLRAVLLALK
jgi:hypothetical protein